MGKFFSVNTVLDACTPYRSAWVQAPILVLIQLTANELSEKQHLSLMCLGNQQRMTQVLGPLPPTQKTQLEC